MKTHEPPIIVEELFVVSKEKLWNAITDAEEMKQWFFHQMEAFEATVGFETQFAVEVGTRCFTHIWEVVEVIPFQKLKYGWRYKEYPGDSYVNFELFEEGTQTKLRLSTEVIEDFPSSVPEFARESGQAGWEYFIKLRLKNHLTTI